MKQALRQYRPALPFYHYSSRNKKDGRPHPVVYHRRDRALTMFWEQRTVEEIAVTLDVSIDTIRSYIRDGRRKGDERAMRRTGQKRIVEAQVRRRQICELSGFGFTAAEIADRLNCHVRLVQIRLKEACGA
ncbi:MAG: hypothetical protein E5Y10_24495 [Mesorhizobium sp.]|nr:MAG: hypothetical protein E5Y10_24495 [Mesorhizobium sp.]